MAAGPIAERNQGKFRLLTLAKTVLRKCIYLCMFPAVPYGILYMINLIWELLYFYNIASLFIQNV